MEVNQAHCMSATYDSRLKGGKKIKITKNIKEGYALLDCGLWWLMV